MSRAEPYEPTVAELLAWMREIPSPSWKETVRSVEYAISELKEDARRARRRAKASQGRGDANPSSQGD